MRTFRKLFQKKEKSFQNTIIIVSGLPRSGTSMMMKMLEAGGFEVVTDNIRTPDEDNPKGYYEFERVKQLKNDNKWLYEARCKVVKVISMLLDQLPADYEYKVIFMQREMQEILASQKKMLIRRKEATDKVSDEELARKFNLHLQKIEKWLENQPNFDVIYVNYNNILKNQIEYCKRINNFLGNRLDITKMAEIIDISLHRQRKTLT